MTEGFSQVPVEGGALNPETPNYKRKTVWQAIQDFWIKNPGGELGYHNDISIPGTPNDNVDLANLKAARRDGSVLQFKEQYEELYARPFKQVLDALDRIVDQEDQRKREAEVKQQNALRMDPTSFRFPNCNHEITRDSVTARRATGILRPRFYDATQKYRDVSFCQSCGTAAPNEDVRDSLNDRPFQTKGSSELRKLRDICKEFNEARKKDFERNVRNSILHDVNMAKTIMNPDQREREVNAILKNSKVKKK